MFIGIDHLLIAGAESASLARQYVGIREAQASDPAGKSALAALVKLMATSGDTSTI